MEGFLNHNRKCSICSEPFKTRESFLCLCSKHLKEAFNARINNEELDWPSEKEEKWQNDMKKIKAKFYRNMRKIKKENRSKYTGTL